MLRIINMPVRNASKVVTKVIGSLKNILKYQTEAFLQHFSSLTNHQYCLCCFPTHPHCIKNQAFRQIYIATKTSTKRKNITKRIYTSAVGYLKRKHFYFFICFSSLLHICPHHPLPKNPKKNKIHYIMYASIRAIRAFVSVELLI
mmetsp:Transcript_12116/g.17942  ORF Transcript_12116/g.17942 Transcript_12116/m.17942 type:complete len:145 (+) Transcript_12116:1-435(+)